MKSYTTLSQAINGLKAKGYKEDFNLTPNTINCASLDLELHPENFHVDDFYRFEGMSNTDDNCIVYAISSDEGIKGLLVDAYGVYSASLSDVMIKKLSIRRHP